MTSRILGAAIGVLLMGGAVYSVFFIDWQPEIEIPPPVVRPLKTMVIQSPFLSNQRKYPGRVDANERVKLAFQVSGILTVFDVKKGQEVQAGELLAQLDPRDFASTLASKEGVLAKAKYDLEKITRLLADGNAGRQEVVDAQATFDVAQAEVAIATKAFEDTTLRAPFAGVIANSFVQNHQNVMAKQAILSLQDVSSIEIEVDVPEERVALSLKYRASFGFRATFDFLPDREFEVTLAEYATEADPATQTFAVVFAMETPDDVAILPGMTATVSGYRKDAIEGEVAVFAVPVDAVPIDGTGNYFVWKVEQSDSGMHSVHRTDVEVGELSGDAILITSGIGPGDRIAAAGVHLLQEGQLIRLLESEVKGTSR